MMKNLNSFNAKKTLKAGGKSYSYFSLAGLPNQETVGRLPVSIKILLENLLRHEDGISTTHDDIQTLISWSPEKNADSEISFRPARVLLQDFTGVPCAVDLAVMRDAMVRMKGDPKKINPLQPVDLVIDHSVQVDEYGTRDAFSLNARLEFERNKERYAFLRWSQQAFKNFRVVPPDTGIVHQVNLEYLAHIVFSSQVEGVAYAYPDTLVGTDSHTTMINGLGVLGWGVGGIEAEAAMLGQPISMLLPQVVGFKLTGTLPPGATATDLVLQITQMLRKKGVVGKFVEFCGPGITSLALADRATIANMAPEYGATMGYFPVDDVTLDYFRFTRPKNDQVQLVEAYCKEQGLFQSPGGPEPVFSDILELDLTSVESCIAGPSRPHDRVPLKSAKSAFRSSLLDMLESRGVKTDRNRLSGWLHPDNQEESPDNPEIARITAKVRTEYQSHSFDLSHGKVVIASITSCTNTSNPSVLIAAGLLAKKAVDLGLSTQPWVKTSLAPGSKVVTDYLSASGLITPLEKLGFFLVGYGCTTCIGNSGPLPTPIADAVQKNDLIVSAVLSGNRNFEGRINSLVRANYLASPPLVVAYAIAGTMDIDFDRDPLGTDPRGKNVYLRDIWPSPDEISDVIGKTITPEMFTKEYQRVFDGNDHWNLLPVPKGDRYAWENQSTYIKAAPFFDTMTPEPAPIRNITTAKVLAVLGDFVTTDHISPAGSIPEKSPAGQYLIAHGVLPKEFNSYGARRGNHEVMMRGTFANIRLRNLMVPGTEGGFTLHPSSPTPVPIYDAAVRYKENNTPLIIIAGKEYGSGSSRDWAAKGPRLLGVRAVIAESFERIHRSNLIGMGVLPLQFESGQNRQSIGLTGFESYEIWGIEDDIRPHKILAVTATDEKLKKLSFNVVLRIDTPMEIEYFRHDGILQYVLRSLLKR